MTARRLGPGDEAILGVLALEDADFDIGGRGGPRPALGPETARRYLANPAVLFWVAFEGAEVAGFLSCLHVPLRSDEGYEVLLYEIGVRAERRREGVGRALLGELETWMAANGVSVAWVLADNPEAVEFYRACGFEAERYQPVYMMRSR